MLKRHFFAFSLVGLAAMGAGCGSDSPVSLEKYRTDKASIGTETQVPNGTTIPAGSPQVNEPPVEGNPPPQPEAAPPPPVKEKAKPPTSTPAMQDTSPPKFPGILPSAETKGYVHLKTTKGDIWFELLAKEGPKAASNFVYLAKRKFYDGLTFHRVVAGFVIQGGDPSGNGTGGPGYQFEDDKVGMPYNEGIVAMANAGPNTNGSQFFIMLANNPLPPSYSIFGRVVKGMDAVKKITMGDKMTEVTIEASKPR